MNNIPTIQQLFTDILADIQSKFSVVVNLVGKSYFRAQAGVQAAKIKLIYLAIGKLQKNVFVDTADPVAQGGTLERFGLVKLNRLPFPATQGQYTVNVTGANGGTIPASTTFKSNDDAQNPGKLFVLDNAFTMVGTTGVITLRALEAGTDSRLNVGEQLTSNTPLNNVNESGTVATEAVAPLAAEDIEDYRSKAIDAYRLEPQGGASSDYRLWAADAQGVKQSYPYAKSGAPNEVDVFVEATIADSTDGKGTPSTAILDAVEAVIELDPDTTKPISERGRRPVGVFMVNVLPVSILNIDVEIIGYQNRTTDKDNLIEDALTEAVNAARPFIGGADVLSEKNDTLNTFILGQVINNAVPGSIYTGINLKVNGVLQAAQSFDNGAIPFFNSVTYV